MFFAINNVTSSVTSTITIDNLKLRPIIDQTGTCYYKTGKVVAECLKPLTKDELVITNTQQYASMLNNVPLSEDEEDVSYNVESLFTNIPIKESIDFICDEIYNRKMLKPICKQSFFKKLLYKLTTEWIRNKDIKAGYLLSFY